MRRVLTGLLWGIKMTERIFYSAQTNGFYPYSLFEDYSEAGSWPQDAVEISERWYSYLLEGQSAGKVISANEYGSPVFSEAPPPTNEQLVAAADNQKAELIAVASEAIVPLQDAVDIGIATDDESARLLAWKKYRVLLNRIDTSIAPDIEWPTTP